MKKKYSYIDIFAGCGGLSLGLYQAGWNGIFAVEKNKDAFETLEHNLIQNKNHFDWPNWLEKGPIDIYELIKSHKEELLKLQGSVDLVVGGPPCQGFSMAGKRMQDDARNKLVEAYIEFIDIIKPKLLFLENVHGFTVGFEKNHKRGKPYSEFVKEELEKLGYHIECNVIKMSDFGVPQSRKRFILVGSLKPIHTSFFEKLIQNKEKFLKEHSLHTEITIDEAIGDLLKSNGTYKNDFMRNFSFGEYGPKKSDYQKLMRANAFNRPDSHRFANHTEETTQVFRELMEKTDKMARITPSMGLVKGFKKRGITVLKPDCICTTVTSIPDDFVHYSEPRILTVREMARIQSFPDWFVFCGKYTTGGSLRKKDVPRFTQVANAVPPLFAEQVGIVLKSMIK